MLIRLGDLILFGVFAAILYFCSSDEKPRPKHSVRAPMVEKDDERLVATVVEPQGSTLEEPIQSAEPSEAVNVQPTGRKANVAGIFGTFECVEYLRDNVPEVHVHQIDQSGQQETPTEIYQEPYESVIDSYTRIRSW